MLTDKIELAEFPPIEDYAESLYSFRAEDYTDIQANEPPNNPYFYLLKYSQDDAAHYKTYAQVLFQDAVGKGCDPQIIRKNLRSIGVHFFGKQLIESPADEAGCVCIRRNGILLKLKIEEEYLIQDGAVYENGIKGHSESARILSCPSVFLRIWIRGLSRYRLPMNLTASGTAGLYQGKS